MSSRKERQQQQKEERAGIVSSSPQEPSKAASFEKPKKPWLKFALICMGALVALMVILGLGYALTPGPYDNFAKCLSEKGATMYGAMGWCKYTQAQKGMFGKSFKYVNYKEFNELQGIKKTPTWVINGAWHENVQPFDKLGALTGCKV